MNRRQSPPDPAARDRAGGPGEYDLFNLPADPPPMVYDGEAPCHRNAGASERDAAEHMSGGRSAALRVWSLAVARERPREGPDRGITIKQLMDVYVERRGPVPASEMSTLRVTLHPRLTELTKGGFLVLDTTVRRDRCAPYVATDAEGDGSVCVRQDGRDANQ